MASKLPLIPVQSILTPVDGGLELLSLGAAVGGSPASFVSGATLDVPVSVPHGMTSV